MHLRKDVLRHFKLTYKNKLGNERQRRIKWLQNEFPNIQYQRIIQF